MSFASLNAWLSIFSTPSGKATFFISEPLKLYAPIVFTVSAIDTSSKFAGIETSFVSALLYNTPLLTL